MAKVFLDSGEQFTVNDNNVSVFGASGEGTEAVMIGSGMQGLIVDQNVESILIDALAYSYRYLQTGNQLNIYHLDGVTLLATIPVQGDSDGTLVIFRDGRAEAKLSGGVMTLAGGTISSTTISNFPIIINDPIPKTDPVPVFFSVTTGSASVIEGGNATFVVSLSLPQGTPTLVNYTLTGTGGAVLGNDTGLPSVSGNGIIVNGSVLTFVPGNTTATITLGIASDPFIETGEGISLTLSNPRPSPGITLGDSTHPASAAIQLQDPAAAASPRLTSDMPSSLGSESHASALTVTSGNMSNPATAGLKMIDTTKIAAAITVNNQEPSQQNCSSSGLASATDIDTSISCHSGTVIQITGSAVDAFT